MAGRFSRRLRARAKANDVPVILLFARRTASAAGVSASELAGQIHSETGTTASEYGARRAAYDIKKLRAKGMVRRIGKSRSTNLLPDGLRSLTAQLVLREKIIRPLLAAGTQPEPTEKPAHPTPVDHHYESLRAGCALSSPNLV